MVVQDPAPATAPPLKATGVYCYGVVRSDSAREQPDGVEGAGVTPIRTGELAALTSPVASAGRMRARRRHLLKHLEVLTSALQDGPVLPLRFGTVFEDETDL